MTPQKKLPICITIDSYHDGGAESYAIRLANHLSETHSVLFIELLPERTHRKEMRNLVNQTVRSTHLFSFDRWVFRNRFYKVQFPWVKALQLRYLLWKYNIRTVLSHSLFSDDFLARWCPRSTFLVSFFHGHYEMKLNFESAIPSHIPSILKRINAVIYTSPNHLNTLNHLGFPPEKRYKLFYGYSGYLARKVTRFSREQPLRFAVVSRAIPEKGWEPTITGFQKLIGEFPGQAELHLVGEGPEYERLRHLQSDSVIFHGFQINPRTVLDECHIGILLTTYPAESQPNSVIEYLFAGKPVITTPMGSIPEMISINGNTAGFVIPVTEHGVDEVAFLQAMRHYLLQPDLVGEHSQLSLACTTHFDMTRNCLELISFLEQQIN